MEIISNTIVRSIECERDLAKAREGDLINVKVSLSDKIKPRVMVYEGVFYKKGAFYNQDAFMEQIGKERILSWRSCRENLNFCNTLENNNGIGVIIFQDWFRDLTEYKPGHELYETKKGILIAAGKWEER